MRSIPKQGNTMRRQGWAHQPFICRGGSNVIVLPLVIGAVCLSFLHQASTAEPDTLRRAASSMYCSTTQGCEQLIKIDGTTITTPIGDTAIERAGSCSLQQEDSEYSHLCNAAGSDDYVVATTRLVSNARSKLVLTGSGGCIQEEVTVKEHDANYNGALSGCSYSKLCNAGECGIHLFDATMALISTATISVGASVMSGSSLVSFKSLQFKAWRVRPDSSIYRSIVSVDVAECKELEALSSDAHMMIVDETDSTYKLLRLAYDQLSGITTATPIIVGKSVSGGECGGGAYKPGHYNPSLEIESVGYKFRGLDSLTWGLDGRIRQFEISGRVHVEQLGKECLLTTTGAKSAIMTVFYDCAGTTLTREFGPYDHPGDLSWTDIDSAEDFNLLPLFANKLSTAILNSDNILDSMITFDFGGTWDVKSCGTRLLHDWESDATTVVDGRAEVTLSGSSLQGAIAGSSFSSSIDSLRNGQGFLGSWSWEMECCQDSQLEPVLCEINNAIAAMVSCADGGACGTLSGTLAQGSLLIDISNGQEQLTTIRWSDGSKDAREFGVQNGFTASCTPSQYHTADGDSGADLSEFCPVANDQMACPPGGLVASSGCSWSDGEEKHLFQGPEDTEFWCSASSRLRFDKGEVQMADAGCEQIYTKWPSDLECVSSDGACALISGRRSAADHDHPCALGARSGGEWICCLPPGSEVDLTDFRQCALSWQDRQSFKDVEWALAEIPSVALGSLGHDGGVDVLSAHCKASGDQEVLAMINDGKKLKWYGPTGCDYEVQIGVDSHNTTLRCPDGESDDTGLSPFSEYSRAQMSLLQNAMEMVYNVLVVDVVGIDHMLRTVDLRRAAACFAFGALYRVSTYRYSSTVATRSVGPAVGVVEERLTCDDFDLSVRSALSELYARSSQESAWCERRLVMSDDALFLLYMQMAAIALLAVGAILKRTCCKPTKTDTASESKESCWAPYLDLLTSPSRAVVYMAAIVAGADVDREGPDKNTGATHQPAKSTPPHNDTQPDAVQVDARVCVDHTYP